MKHPSSENVYIIADTLQTVALFMGNEVEMGNPSTYENLCGTPCCHGGWFEFALNEELHSDYNRGAQEMAKFLGFSSEVQLYCWAEDNPTIWGNGWGGYMFCGPKAFNYKGEKLTLTGIADHWRAVGDRLKEMGL